MLRAWLSSTTLTRYTGLLMDVPVDPWSSYWDSLFLFFWPLRETEDFGEDLLCLHVFKYLGIIVAARRVSQETM